MLGLMALSFSCDAWDIRTIPSPDERFEAILHESDCGATTSYNSQVSVIRRVIGFEYSREPLFSVHGLYSIPVRWIDEKTLAIGVPAGEQVYRKEAIFGGGRVVYENNVAVPTRAQAEP